MGRRKHLPHRAVLRELNHPDDVGVLADCTINSRFALHSFDCRLKRLPKWGSFVKKPSVSKKTSGHCVLLVAHCSPPNPALPRGLSEGDLQRNFLAIGVSLGAAANAQEATQEQS